MRDLRVRVAIIASTYPSFDDPAAGWSVRDQAEVLSTACDVRVVAPATVTARDVLRGRVRPRALTDEPPAPRVARPLAGRIATAPGLEVASWDRAVERSLRAQWGRERPDVLHAHGILPAGLAAVHVGRRLGVPVIVTTHDGPLSARLDPVRPGALVREALAGSSRLIATGDWLAAGIGEMADVPVEVVPEVVHPAFLDGTLPTTRAPGPLRILGVGPHDALTHLDHVVAAVAIAVTEGGLDAELVLAGQGPNLAYTRAFAGRLGIGDRVRFEPPPDRRALLDHLAWCDILVSASDHDSFPLVLAQALGAGRPVLATASAGARAVVEPGLGRVVPRADAELFASDLVDTPAWLEAFDPAFARARMAERFGPESFLARIGAIYDAVRAEARR